MSDEQEPKFLSFEEICYISDAHEECLKTDKIIFDMVGDHAAAMVLSKLRYWFSPSRRDGQKRTRISHLGKDWIARSQLDWWEECRVTNKQMRRIRKLLTDLGLVTCKVFIFKNERCLHWNLNIQAFTEKLNEMIQKNMLQMPKSHVPKCPKGNFQNAQRAVSIYNPLKQSTYTSSLSKYPPPAGGGGPAGQCALQEEGRGGEPGASPGDVDEFNHPNFEPRLIGEAKRLFKALEFEQKYAFMLIMNVPPTSPSDRRFNAISAAQIAKSKTLEEVRTAIACYKDRLRSGRIPKSMGATLHAIIKSGHTPISGEARKHQKNGEKYVQ